MTSEESGQYLSFVYITKINGKPKIAINAEDKWSMDLPPLFRKEAVETAIYALCEKHAIDYIGEDTVRNAANEAIREYYHKSNEPEPPSSEITREVTFDEIADILSSTIKKDDPAKLITFSAFLLAQTETDQINIGFQSESSAGKSYIPTEMSTYFPEEEVWLLAGASPKAFFHDRAEAIMEDTDQIDEKTKKPIQRVKHYVVDIENKILIFLDQPHYLLLETLRPVLSHDKKELVYKITDKNTSGANKTKTIVVRGFPAVAFATTKMNPDEQEKTRMIMLSPSVDHDKLEESLKLLTLKKGDPEEYDSRIKQDPHRIFLIERIKAIRERGVKEVIIPNSEESIFKRFIERHKHLIARHQRDYPRIFSLIKAHALLNCFNRETKNGHVVIANTTDVDAGFKLYETIEESNELGLSPHIYKIYSEVIKPLLTEVGVDRREIQRKYYSVYHKVLSPEVFRQEILPQLEAAGFVAQEPDPDDKRRMLLYPAFYENNIVGRSGGTPIITLDTLPPNAPTISPNQESQFLDAYNKAAAEYEGGNPQEFKIVSKLIAEHSWEEDRARAFVNKRLRNSKAVPYFIEWKTDRWQKC